MWRVRGGGGWRGYACGKRWLRAPEAEGRSEQWAGGGGRRGQRTHPSPPPPPPLTNPTAHETNAHSPLTPTPHTHLAHSPPKHSDDDEGAGTPEPDKDTELAKARELSKWNGCYVGSGA